MGRTRIAGRVLGDWRAVGVIFDATVPAVNANRRSASVDDAALMRAGSGAAVKPVSCNSRGGVFSADGAGSGKVVKLVN